MDCDTTASRWTRLIKLRKLAGGGYLQDHQTFGDARPAPAMGYSQAQIEDIEEY